MLTVVYLSVILFSDERSACLLSDLYKYLIKLSGDGLMYLLSDEIESLLFFDLLNFTHYRKEANYV